MKKVCTMILLLCLTFGMQVWAREVTEEPSVSQEMPAEVPSPPQGQAPQQGQMPPQGERPQGQWNRGQMPPQGQMPWEQGENQPTETDTPMTEQTERSATDEEKTITERNGAEVRRMPQMMGNAQITSEPMSVLDFLKTYSTSVVAVVLLIGAFAFVKLYKRKMY